MYLSAATFFFYYFLSSGQPPSSWKIVMENPLQMAMRARNILGLAPSNWVYQVVTLFSGGARLLSRLRVCAAVAIGAAGGELGCI